MTKKKTKSKKTTARAKSKPAKMKVVKPDPPKGKPEKLHFKIEMDTENTHICAEGNMEKIARNLAGLIVRYPKTLTIFEDAICLVRHQIFIEKEYLKNEKKENNETTK